MTISNVWFENTEEQEQVVVGFQLNYSFPPQHIPKCIFTEHKETEDHCYSCVSAGIGSDDSGVCVHCATTCLKVHHYFKMSNYLCYFFFFFFTLE